MDDDFEDDLDRIDDSDDDKLGNADLYALILAALEKTQTMPQFSYDMADSKVEMLARFITDEINLPLFTNILAKTKDLLVEVLEEVEGKVAEVRVEVLANYENAGI